MPDGRCRTVKAQYQQSSLANFIRARGGGYAATGVIEIVYEQDSDSRILLEESAERSSL